METKDEKRGFMWDNIVYPVGSRLHILPHSERCLGEIGIVVSNLINGKEIFSVACMECLKQGMIPGDLVNRVG
jgi:hypothetical protein